MPSLVSVICVCYNHEAFVGEALRSVLWQTYPHYEMIIVDDASTDKSRQEIQKFIQDVPAYQKAYAQSNGAKARGPKRIKFLPLGQNQGNCIAFNRAWEQAQGDYIIDFATDDIMLDHRLEKQVAYWDTCGDGYGVIFSNALLINATGQALGYHFPINAQGHSQVKVPQGDIYAELMHRYFICTPTMMVRREVLEKLGGYDEDLSYEDFDFWLRSARHFRYAYQDEVLTYYRRHQGSLSGRVWRKGQPAYWDSTYKVLTKAQQMNLKPQENQALGRALQYYKRQAWLTQHYEVASCMVLLEKSLNQPKTWEGRLVDWAIKQKIPLYWAYRLFIRLRNYWKSRR